MRTGFHPALRAANSLLVLAVLFVQMGLLGQACVCPMPMDGQGGGSGMVGMAVGGGHSDDATSTGQEQRGDHEDQDPARPCKCMGCCFACLTFLPTPPAGTPSPETVAVRVPVPAPSSIEGNASLFLIPEAIPPPARAS